MTYLERLSKNTARLEMTTTTSIDTLRLEILDALKGSLEDVTSPLLASVGDRLTELSRQSRALGKQQKILESLSFKNMDSRYSSIEKQHEETFKWIFQTSNTEFVDWLKTGSGIYWIEGKAGSGKSTLMKYLVNVDNTRNSLKEWAGDSQLLVGSYFFWARGPPLQRSEEGLLRTMLFQVLRGCPDLILSVCPERWTGQGGSYPEAWEHNELVQALDVVAKQTLAYCRFCFFVDGLDEFSGNQLALVQLVKRLAASPSIKLCVSSRPWNPFENAFRGKVPQLKLETLTNGDIQKYINDKLDPLFENGDHNPGDKERIVNEIAFRARGVFLWVYLVVDSLLRGHEEEDDVRDMQRRLDSLPEDLEDFFKRMLSTIDKVYWEQTAKIILVLLHAEEPLPALAFWYLEQEETDEQYALKMNTTKLSLVEIDRLSERMRKRINARCRDLLQITVNHRTQTSFRYTVDFFHRTVRDFFINTTAIHISFNAHTKPTFAPSLSLCRIMLALAKTDDMTFDLTFDAGRIHASFGLAVLRYALEFERGRSPENKLPHQMLEEFNILDDLQRVWIGLSCKERRLHWVLREDNSLRWPNILEQMDDENFLCQCIQRGLLYYVQHRLAREPSLVQGYKARLYLLYAFHGICGPYKSDHRHQQGALETLQFLLEGQLLDPNLIVGWRSVWRQCVTYAVDPDGWRPAITRAYICDAMKLFLRNGADPNVVCDLDANDGRDESVDSRTALSILQELWPTEATAFEKIANTRHGTSPAERSSEI
jgi:hypothetical protein